MDCRKLPGSIVPVCVGVVSQTVPFESATQVSRRPPEFPAINDRNTFLPVAILPKSREEGCTSSVASLGIMVKPSYAVRAPRFSVAEGVWDPKPQLSLSAKAGLNVHADLH